MVMVVPRSDSFDLECVQEYLKKHPQPSKQTMEQFKPSNPKNTEGWQDFVYNDPWDHKIRIFKLAGWDPITDNFGGLDQVQLRYLGPEGHMTKFVELDECKVISISSVETYIEDVGIRCAKCGEKWIAAYNETVAGGGLGAKKKERFCCPNQRIVDNLDSEDTTFVDSQYIRLMEVKPPRGEAAVIMAALVKGKDMMGQFRSNDRIKPRGLLRFRPIKNQKDGSTRFFMWFEIVTFKRVVDEDRDIQLTPEDITYIKKEMQDGPTFYEKLIASFCPILKGEEILNECALLALGSIGFNHPARILILADPSTGKSTLLKYASKVSPNVSFYVAMNKASKTGLTTTSEQDKETNRWMVTPGLFPAANNGLICIDELQLADERDLGNLNSVVEDLKVYYAQVGGNYGSFDANCALLMACNPHEGEMKDETNIKYLLKFMGKDLPQFLSRINFVAVIKDDPTDNWEAEADKIRHMYRNTEQDPMLKYEENWLSDTDFEEKTYNIVQGLSITIKVPMERFGTKWIKKILHYIVHNVEVEEMPKEYEDYITNYYLKNKKDIVARVNKLITKRYARHAIVLCQIVARLQGLSKPNKQIIDYVLDFYEKNMTVAAYNGRTKEIEANMFEANKSKSEIAKIDSKTAVKDAIDSFMGERDPDGNLLHDRFKVEDIAKKLYWQDPFKWGDQLLVARQIDGLLRSKKIYEKGQEGSEEYAPSW